MSMFLLLDVAGFILNAIGAWEVGHKRRRGFLFWIAASACHGIIGYLSVAYGIMVTCIMFFLMDCYFYWKWGKDE